MRESERFFKMMQKDDFFEGWDAVENCFESDGDATIVIRVCDSVDFVFDYNTGDFIEAILR